VLPGDKGLSGVLSTPIAAVLPDNEGVITWGKDDSLRRVTGVQSLFDFLEVGGSIYGDPGDLSLNVKLCLPAIERNGYRLSFALGAIDIAGGRVVDRYGFGVSSLELPHARFTAGVSHDGEWMSGVELEPLVSWSRLLASESQAGFALLAPGWGSARLSWNYSDGERSWQVAAQRSLDSLLTVPAHSERWRVHYEPYPDLFDVVAVETGPYHYQLLLAHNISLRGLNPWSGALQVRQPLVHSRELEDGRSLARFREEGVALRQSALAYATKPFVAGFGDMRAEAMAGTYAVDWWFWRLAGRFESKYAILDGYVSYFDNPELNEYRWVWVPALTVPFFNGRYALRVYGGDFWEQDRALGVALEKHLGSTKVSFDAQRVVDGVANTPVHWIGARVSLALCLPRDVRLGTSHLTVNGPRSWEYGLRTRLIKPGASNTVAPGLVREPAWVLPPFDDSF